MENRFEKTESSEAKRSPSQAAGDSVHSMKSIEDVAAGRPIRTYPYRYDSFDNYSTMKEYIINVFMDDKNATKLINNLRADKVSVASMINRKDVYYTNVDVIQVHAYQDHDPDCGCFKNGVHLCSLNPHDWDIEQVGKIIEEIKKELSGENAEN